LKKSFFVLPAIALGVAALACAQTPGATPVKPPAPTSGVVPTKIAVINVQQAIFSTAEGKKSLAELSTKFTPRQEALKKREADIQQQRDQLKKGGATMSDEAKAQLSRDIDGKTKALQRDADDLNADGEQEQNRVMQDIGGKMTAVWNQYLTLNNFAILLEVGNQQTPVLWIATSIDITDDIIKLYDQAHPVSGATAPAAKPAAPPATKK
jgi:outer membrane protein